jgi:hypothetical protein
MNGMNSYFRGGKCGILLLFALNDVNARRSWVFGWIDSVAGGMHCNETHRLQCQYSSFTFFFLFLRDTSLQAETSSPFAGHLSMLSSLVVLIPKNNTTPAVHPFFVLDGIWFLSSSFHSRMKHKKNLSPLNEFLSAPNSFQ